MQDNFKFLVVIVLSASTLCGVAAIIVGLLAANGDPEILRELFDTFLNLFTLGIGTIFGLISGAAVSRVPQRKSNSNHP